MYLPTISSQYSAGKACHLLKMCDDSLASVQSVIHTDTNKHPLGQCEAMAPVHVDIVLICGVCIFRSDNAKSVLFSSQELYEGCLQKHRCPLTKMQPCISVRGHKHKYAARAVYYRSKAGYSHILNTMWGSSVQVTWVRRNSWRTLRYITGKHKVSSGQNCSQERHYICMRSDVDVLICVSNH